jgi:hypothetical protein
MQSLTKFFINCSRILEIGTDNYKPAAKTTAPPSNAPKPIAPVGIAPIAPPVEELLVCAAVAELEMVVLAIIPDVKGTVETEDAPLNAADVVLGFGVAPVLLGLRTLSKWLAMRRDCVLHLG